MVGGVLPHGPELASTFDADGNLRGQVVADLHSAANTIATTIDNEIEVALVGLDAEYAALCSELVLA